MRDNSRSGTNEYSNQAKDGVTKGVSAYKSVVKRGSGILGSTVNSAGRLKYSKKEYIQATQRKKDLEKSIRSRIDTHDRLNKELSDLQNDLSAAKKDVETARKDAAQLNKKRYEIKEKKKKLLNESVSDNNDIAENTRLIEEDMKLAEDEASAVARMKKAEAKVTEIKNKIEAKQEELRLNDNAKFSESEALSEVEKILADDPKHKKDIKTRARVESRAKKSNPGTAKEVKTAGYESAQNQKNAQNVKKANIQKQKKATFLKKNRKAASKAGLTKAGSAGYKSTNTPISNGGSSNVSLKGITRGKTVNSRLFFATLLVLALFITSLLLPVMGGAVFALDSLQKMMSNFVNGLFDPSKPLMTENCVRDEIFLVDEEYNKSIDDLIKELVNYDKEDEFTEETIVTNRPTSWQKKIALAYLYAVRPYEAPLEMAEGKSFYIDDKEHPDDALTYVTESRFADIVAECGKHKENWTVEKFDELKLSLGDEAAMHDIVRQLNHNIVTPVSEPDRQDIDDDGNIIPVSAHAEIKCNVLPESYEDVLKNNKHLNDEQKSHAIVQIRACLDDNPASEPDFYWFWYWVTYTPPTTGSADFAKAFTGRAMYEWARTGGWVGSSPFGNASSYAALKTPSTNWTKYLDQFKTDYPNEIAVLTSTAAKHNAVVRHDAQTKDNWAVRPDSEQGYAYNDYKEPNQSVKPYWRYIADNSGGNAKGWCAAFVSFCAKNGNVGYFEYPAVYHLSFEGTTGEKIRSVKDANIFNLTTEERLQLFKDYEAAKQNVTLTSVNTPPLVSQNPDENDPAQYPGPAWAYEHGYPDDPLSVYYMMSYSYFVKPDGKIADLWLYSDKIPVTLAQSGQKTSNESVWGSGKGSYAAANGKISLELRKNALPVSSEFMKNNSVNVSYEHKKGSSVPVFSEWFIDYGNGLAGGLYQTKSQGSHGTFSDLILASCVNKNSEPVIYDLLAEVPQKNLNLISTGASCGANFWNQRTGPKCGTWHPKEEFDSGDFTPEAGDLVLYRGHMHIGIVVAKYQVNGITYWATVEGNSGGGANAQGHRHVVMHIRNKSYFSSSLKASTGTGGFIRINWSDT